MAGRGVDIILGGNPQNKEEYEKVKKLGGLHVIGTERHEARRIDNQLRGRAGRQGDPGSSQFFLSLEDDLMRVFGGERIKSLMGILNFPEDEPIESSLVSKAIDEAQSKIEGLNFDLRKNLLEYDNVMNLHRETIYKKRKEILASLPDDLIKKVENLFLKNGFSKDDFKEKERKLGKEKFYQLLKFIFLKVIDAFWIEHLENMEYLRETVQLRAYGQRDPLLEYKAEANKMFKKLLDNIDLTIINTISKIKIQ
jgi:preprotein translocase subunit SecA